MKFEIAKDWEGRAFLPEYSTRHSAGADFFAAKEIIIEPGKCGLVHTGIKAQMPDDTALFIFNRSGGPKRGLMLANSVGIIDSDYYGNESNDGEIMFNFYNISGGNVTIKKGDKIGQGVFMKFLRPENAIIHDEERRGGFGSTGQ